MGNASSGWAYVGNAGAGGGVDVVIGGNTSGATASVSSGTLFLAGGNNVTLSQNGQSITISGGTIAGQPVNFSAGTTSSALGSVVFSNSNAMSFGLNGSTITGSFSQSAQTQASGNIVGSGFTSTTTAGSVLVGTQNSAGLSVGVPAWLTAAGGGGFSGGVSTGGGTSGNTGTYSGQIIFAGGNNITLSVSSGAAGAQTITISGANLGGAQTGISGVIVSNTTYTSGTVSFSNANGITFGSSAGQAITASYNSTQFAGTGSSITGNASITLNSAGIAFNGTNLAGVGTSITGRASITMNSAGIAFNGSALAGTSTGATNASVTLNSSGIAISVAAPGGGGGWQLSAGASSQSTGTIVFSNSNNVSFGLSTGAAAAGTVTGSYALNVSAPGGTSNALSGITFTNSGGVSFGLSTGAGVGTLSAAVATTAAYYFSGNTTGQSSSSTANDQSLSIGASGGLSGGWTNGSWIFSAPAVSSLSATGWASLSVNGSTISVGAAAPQLSFFQPLGPVQSTTVTQNGLGSVQVYPAIAAFPFTASRADIMVSVSASALALSTQAQTLSMYVGLYSLNASTLSLASSGSQSYAWSNSSNNSNASITGLRRFSAPINVNYTGGFDLFIGVMTNTTFVNTNGISLSNVVVPLGPGPQLQGLIGQVPANSMQFVPGQGFFSTTSAALPSSIALSAISGAGSGGNAVDNYAPVQFANVTA